MRISPAVLLLAVAIPASAVESVPVLMYHIVLDPARDWDCFEPGSCAGAERPTPKPVSAEVAGACGAAPAAPSGAVWAPGGGAPDPHLTVSPASFDRQMRFLRDGGYRTLTLDEVFAARVPLTARDVVVTFDDGYADNYAVAYPILRRHGLKANLFMVSDNVGRPGRLSAAQLREMDAGGFKVWAHTKTHARLDELPASRQCEELRASKEELEGLLGRPVAYLAYPYGRFRDGVTESIARDAGYAAVLSTAPGVCVRGAAGFAKCGRSRVTDAEPNSFLRAVEAPR